MEASATVATWLSFAVTAVGLGGLISQANAINDKMDPFHSYRNVEYMGIWFRRQPAFPWWIIAKPTPVGPELRASLTDGFCGVQEVHMTRLPVTETGLAGQAGWAVLLSILHAYAPASSRASDVSVAEKGPGIMNAIEAAEKSSEIVEISAWSALPRQQLKRCQSSACITITRTTLITLLCLTNARKGIQYSDASGFRATYASYSGQWYINWPIGEPAMVKLMAHDSHKISTDVYPRSFTRRTEGCINMQAGIVPSLSGSLKVAFCGRKRPGSYTLECVPKGFAGAHGSRHLYNMMGGKVYEVDFMSAVKTSEPSREADTMIIDLPSTEVPHKVTMSIPKESQEVIKIALDCLPWSSLAWSIHRGMRDVLIAYGKPIMDAHRRELAQMLKRTVAENPQAFEVFGWEPRFVRYSMGDMAASAILAGSGDSGDLVRVVTDIVRVIVPDWRMENLDEVEFWRSADQKLNHAGVVALTKFFVLEWSVEVDYQLYHELPITLNFG